MVELSAVNVCAAINCDVVACVAVALKLCCSRLHYGKLRCGGTVVNYAAVNCVAMVVQ